MSQDWLIRSPRPVDFADIVAAVNQIAPHAGLRADRSGRFVVVVDEQDVPAVWFGPSREVQDERAELVRYVPEGQPVAGTAWWTEVVAPAARSADGAQLSGQLAELAQTLAGILQGRAHLLGAAPDDGVRGPATTGGEDDLFDLIGDRAAVSLQTRAVLGLTSWLTGCLLWARDHERQLVLLTPRTTRLTPVLAQLVARGAVRWVADDGAVAHDTLTGQQVAWDGAGFTESDTTIQAERPLGEESWVLVVEADTMHEGSAGTVIGPFLQQVCGACGLGPIVGQGLMEPVESPWDEGTLTAYARAQSPGPARLVVRGRDHDGLASVVPQPVGLLERLELTADAPAELLNEDGLRAMGHGLLDAGSQLAVLGYRRSTGTRLVDAWPSGPVLPGLIAVQASRFPGLSEHDLRELLPEGALSAATPSGWVMTFPAPDAPSPPDGVELPRQWDAVLPLLESHDRIAQAERAQRGG